MLRAEAMLIEQIFFRGDLAETIGHAEALHPRGPALGQHLADGAAQAAQDALVLDSDDAGGLPR